MALPRPTTPDDRRALKIATQRTIQMCGGQDSAASITRVHAKTLSDYGNTGNERHVETFIPLDVLGDFVRDCRERGDVAAVVHAICELAGGRFVPARGDSPREMVESAMRELVAAHEILTAREEDE